MLGEGQMVAITCKLVYTKHCYIVGKECVTIRITGFAVWYTAPRFGEYRVYYVSYPGMDPSIFE